MDIYLPRIAPADFEAFRKLLKDEIAPTFQEWLKGHQEKLDYYRSPDVVIEVDVSPDEFKRFCDEKGAAYNARSFYDFAGIIGERKP
jgi:hypothetical protein